MCVFSFGLGSRQNSLLTTRAFRFAIRIDSKGFDSRIDSFCKKNQPFDSQSPGFV